MNLSELNAMDQLRFVSALGWVFENSPWVAERTWPRAPFETVDALHAAMTLTVQVANRGDQLALLRAHPDLGTRAKISDASRAEQASAGLHQESEQLNRMNVMYRDKFGFPFIFAVRGGTKHDILRDLEHRLSSPAEAEFQRALQHVYSIARFRLEDTVQGE